MDPDLAGFFEQYLNVEVAYSYMDGIKEVVRTSGWREKQRRLFEQMLAERSMTRGEYCERTWVDFETDDDMYAYLTKVYAYFFLDREELPIPPE
ncbi:hypothetical protein P3T27_002846 [Kitasatospora sp. MAA19]|uniref:hypothetical protein n=1 Tax=Kitasatospora sp. MAA19 TaxID=3035090 RepID=UPI002475AB70|nr:hypothetical protein [Kitasatospora sp. MAA19]MDH6706123.1 hypothetical protein [Kitasatospora sp. MAA19]